MTQQRNETSDQPKGQLTLEDKMKKKVSGFTRKVSTMRVQCEDLHQRNELLEQMTIRKTAQATSSEILHIAIPDSPSAV